MKSKKPRKISKALQAELKKLKREFEQDERERLKREVLDLDIEKSEATHNGE